jgi:hypothetical protein
MLRSAGDLNAVVIIDMYLLLYTLASYLAFSCLFAPFFVFSVYNLPLWFFSWLFYDIFLPDRACN